ncbi:MAG: ribosome maturation factor RimP [Vulcanimicrobiaceae bacterium]
MALEDAFERAVDGLRYDRSFGDVEFVSHGARRHGKSFALHVTVDRTGGVDLALCERVATALRSQLQEFEEHFTLEVESAGLNRPLRAPGDYERFAGSAAKILTTLLIGGAKTHRGVLRGVRGTNVLLETEHGSLPLPLATIKSANLEYDIRGDLKREKAERKL